MENFKLVLFLTCCTIWHTYIILKENKYQLWTLFAERKKYYLNWQILFDCLFFEMFFVLVFNYWYWVLFFNHSTICHHWLVWLRTQMKNAGFNLTEKRAEPMKCDFIRILQRVVSGWVDCLESWKAEYLFKSVADLTWKEED